MKIPKLFAFDLDGTVWTPDMYMLWGGGAPFTKHKGNQLKDSRGTTVRLLGITDRILYDLKHDERYSGIKIAWVSCTDEPSWADECMKKFTCTSPDGVTGPALVELADSSQIFKSNKRTHFNRLKEAYPDIDYEDMIFFDNEMGNINSVSKLGVHCIFCPDGLTRDVWETTLTYFSKKD